MKSLMVLLVTLPSMTLAAELPGGLLQSEYDAWQLALGSYNKPIEATSDPASITATRRVLAILAVDSSVSIDEQDRSTLERIAKAHTARAEALPDQQQSSCELVLDRPVDAVDIEALIELGWEATESYERLAEETFATLKKELTPEGWSAVNEHVEDLADSGAIYDFDFERAFRDHPRAFAYVMQQQCEKERRPPDSVCPYSDLEIAAFDEEKSRARFRWQELALDSYRFEYRMHGHWISEEAVVVVRDGVSDLAPDSAFAERFGVADPISAVLDRIPDRNSNVCVDAEFDANLGYPLRYTSRPKEAGWANARFGFEISMLEVH